MHTGLEPLLSHAPWILSLIHSVYFLSSLWPGSSKVGNRPAHRGQWGCPGGGGGAALTVLPPNDTCSRPNTWGKRQTEAHVAGVERGK